MTENTPIHISYVGSSDDYIWNYLLYYMLGVDYEEVGGC
mgnify:CR=1 FL=1